MLKAYLVLYNLAMLGGWTAVLATTVRYFAVFGWKPAGLYGSFAGLFAALLTCSQLAMIMDPIHAALGFVRSPFFTAALQLISPSLGVTLLAFAWSVTEVVRYFYYAMNTAGLAIPGVVTWLRYSMFFVLYPMGVAGELLVLYAASSVLPKQYVNAAIAVTALVYLVGFPKLYLYMISQRSKTLYGAAADKKKKKK